MPIRRRYIGEPHFHLATRPLLPQHDGAARIVAHDVERVLADIDADHGDRAVGCLRHGVLLVLAPLTSLSLAGQEHGRTIPLAVGPMVSPNCLFHPELISISDDEMATATNVISVD